MLSFSRRPLLRTFLGLALVLSCNLPSQIPTFIPKSGCMHVVKLTLHSFAIVVAAELMLPSIACR